MLPLDSFPCLLAQVPGLDIPTPSGLPSPGPVSLYLFERPMLPAAVLLVSAVVLYVVCNTRGKPGRGFALAGAMVALAGALVLTASFVRTDREILLEQSRRLVRAVATADPATAGAILADDCRLEPRGPVPAADRDRILALLASDFASGASNAVREHAILEAQASIDGPNVGRAQIKVRVTPESTGAPFFSWWLLDFRSDPPGGWRVTRITPLSLSGWGEAR